MATVSSPSLRIVFSSLSDFAREFDTNLSNYGLFVPTGEVRSLRDVLDFVVVLPDGRGELRGRGEVMYRVGEPGSAQETGKCGLGLHVIDFEMDKAHLARNTIGNPADPVVPGPVTAEECARAARAYQERRMWPRYAARLAVRFRTAEQLGAGLTADVSRGGLYLRTHEPFPIGMGLMLSITDPADQGELVVSGEVARVPLLVDGAGPPIGLGIRFRELTESSREQVERLLRVLDRKDRPDGENEAAEDSENLVQL